MLQNHQIAAGSDAHFAGIYLLKVQKLSTTLPSWMAIRSQRVRRIWTPCDFLVPEHFKTSACSSLPICTHLGTSLVIQSLFGGIHVSLNLTALLLTFAVAQKPVPRIFCVGCESTGKHPSYLQDSQYSSICHSQHSLLQAGFLPLD